MSEVRRCWCGNTKLAPYSPDYLLCENCQTLVTGQAAGQREARVRNDETDFYGRKYWFEHQEKELGFTNIETRARTDLTERCQHWLRAILRYKVPPARTLELGCAHGGFVAMLRSAGYDSAGLELSPWIVDFAKRTFDVPMFQGPIEEQKIKAKSLDMIIAMDVMEHLPDPVGTLRRCAELLKPEGILAIQTPRFPVGRSYAEMVAGKDPFLELLKPDEHLYLFSEQSAAQIFRLVGLSYAAVEPAMFARYDMFLFVSASEVRARDEKKMEKALLGSAQGRMTLTWLDMNRQTTNLQKTLTEVEEDRAKRLEQIQTLTAQVPMLNLKVQKSDESIAVIEADRAKRLEQIETLTAQVKQKNLEIRTMHDLIAEIEVDRAKRLEQIETLTAQVKRRDQEAVDLKGSISVIEADRTKRLENIKILTAQVELMREDGNKMQAALVESQADRANLLAKVNDLSEQVRKMTGRLEQNAQRKALKQGKSEK